MYIIRLIIKLYENPLRSKMIGIKVQYKIGYQ